jgi:hypothetical protein
MADVASKQQTTTLFLPTIVTRTRRHTELTKTRQTCWETCAVSENIQVSFRAIFYTVKLHRLTQRVWGPQENRITKKCSAHDSEEKCIKLVVGKPECCRHSCNRKDNNKTDLEEICGGTRTGVRWLNTEHLWGTWPSDLLKGEELQTNWANILFMFSENKLIHTFRYWNRMLF